jgi:ATP-dependent RNA helicase DDX55/SPB4
MIRRVVQEKFRRAESKQINSAWSNQVAKKEVREVRKEKKARKRRWEKTQENTVDTAGSKESSGKRKAVNEAGAEDDGDQWEELAREERMAKKMRTGQISERVFDEQFGEL